MGYMTTDVAVGTFQSMSFSYGVLLALLCLRGEEIDDKENTKGAPFWRHRSFGVLLIAVCLFFKNRRLAWFFSSNSRNPNQFFLPEKWVGVFFCWFGSDDTTTSFPLFSFYFCGEIQTTEDWTFSNFCLLGVFQNSFLKRSFTGGLNNAAKNKNVSLVAVLYPFSFAGPPLHRIHPIFDVDKREGCLLYYLCML